jgi:hypothetical protein
MTTFQLADNNKVHKLITNSDFSITSENETNENVCVNVKDKTEYGSEPILMTGTLTTYT